MKAIKRMSRILDLKEGNSILTEQTNPKLQTLNSFQSTKHNFLSTAKEKCPYPLTIDCLEEILSHLIDDKVTLFSCISVNSLWLNLCVPLLWSNPFEHFTYQKGNLLIRTYISCLSIQDKQKLHKFYQDSNNNNDRNRKNKKKRFSIISIRNQPFNYQQTNSFSLNQEPLFIYPKYLQWLNCDKFDLALKEYCYWNRPLTNSFHEYKSLVFKLLKNLLFNNNSIILKHLKISFNDEIESFLLYDNDSINNNNITMTTSGNTFTRLTSLDLSYVSSSENNKMVSQQVSNICLHLSTHSTHIQCLIIYVQGWWEDEFKQQVCYSLFNLIKSQKNLKFLSINEFWNTNYNIEYFDQFYQILLQHASNTLECLQFNKLTQFPSFAPKFCSLLSSLPKLHSLTITKFWYSSDIDSRYLAANLPNNLYHFKTDIFNNSESLSYFLENCHTKLSVLEVYQQLVNDDTLKAVLNYKKSGGKLREFRYSGWRIIFTTQTWELTKTILPGLVKVNWNNNNNYYY